MSKANLHMEAAIARVEEENLPVQAAKTSQLSPVEKAAEAADSLVECFLRSGQEVKWQKVSLSEYIATKVRIGRGSDLADFHGKGTAGEVREIRRAQSKWYSNPGMMPQLLDQAEWSLYKHQERLFDTEKEAISAARMNALKEESQWRANINALDERYDAIEDEEMAVQG